EVAGPAHASAAACSVHGLRNWAQTWLCRDRDDGRGWLSGTDRPEGRHGVSWCGSGADLALGAATAVDAMPTLRRVRDFQVSGRVSSPAADVDADVRSNADPRT